MEDDEIIYNQDKYFMQTFAKEKEKPKKNVFQLSKLSSIEIEKAEEVTFSDIRNLTKDSKDPNMLFKFICEKSKSVINILVKRKLREIKHRQDQNKIFNESILQEPLGVVLKKYPDILEFENKKLFFMLELNVIKRKGKYHTV